MIHVISEWVQSGFYSKAIIGINAILFIVST